MITERTLRKWRTDALTAVEDESKYSIYDGTAASLARHYVEVNKRILRMTQDMLDYHLLRKRRA